MTKKLLVQIKNEWRNNLWVALELLCIYSASNLTDENMRTYWTAKTGEPGEWIEIDLGAMKHIKAIQLNYYDHKSVQHNRANDLYYQYRIYSSDNGTDWTLAVDKSDNDKDVPHDYIELGAVSYTHLRTDIQP